MGYIKFSSLPNGPIGHDIRSQYYLLSHKMSKQSKTYSKLIDEESEQAANDADPDAEKESFIEIDYDGLNQEDIESMEMPENEAAEEIQTEFSELTLEELEQ